MIAMKGDRIEGDGVFIAPCDYCQVYEEERIVEVAPETTGDPEPPRPTRGKHVDLKAQIGDLIEFDTFDGVRQGRLQSIAASNPPRWVVAVSDSGQQWQVDEYTLIRVADETTGDPEPSRPTRPKRHPADRPTGFATWEDALAWKDLRIADLERDLRTARERLVRIAELSR